MIDVSLDIVWFRRFEDFRNSLDMIKQNSKINFKKLNIFASVFEMWVKRDYEKSLIDRIGFHFRVSKINETYRTIAFAVKTFIFKRFFSVNIR